MLNTVFCRSCKAQIDPHDIFCRACGADQRPSSQQQAPQQVLPVQSPQSIYQPVNPQLSVNYVLEEHSRQYLWLSKLQFYGALGIFAYGLGLLVVIYTVMQKSTLRRKVAELGYDPEVWERALRKQAAKWEAGCLVTILVVVGGIAAFVYFTSKAMTPP
jgi:hypothetical protein